MTMPVYLASLWSAVLTRQIHDLLQIKVVLDLGVVQLSCFMRTTVLLSAAGADCGTRHVFLALAW